MSNSYSCLQTLNRTIEITHPIIGKTPTSSFTRLDFFGYTFWFSYKTIVAFNIDGSTVISENRWSRTTGKHLNYIDDDHSKRISYDLFQKKLIHVLRSMGDSLDGIEQVL